RQRAERLEPSLSKLTIEVPEPSRVPGLEVARNGTVIHKGAWGMPLPVDPGEQRIVVQAPGYQPHTLVVAVEKGSTAAKVDIPPLLRAPLPAVSDAAPGQAVPGQAGSLPGVAVTTSEPERSPKLKLVGIIVGSAGVALLGVGSGFGIRAINKNNDAKDAGCRKKSCPPGDGVDLTNQALTASKVANVGIIGGGALVVGGLLTYFLAPKAERQTKVAFSTDAHSLALHVGGAF
ncbi:MAG: hypothetical protein RLZZ450_7323, partial [Pseudomonadota bacterium]